MVLLERDDIFGSRPGETMHPGIHSLLDQLGFSAQLSQIATGLHTGIWIEWNSPPRFEAYGYDENGPWQGFHVWRPDFDTALLLLAGELGVDVYRGVTISGITEEQGEIRQIKTSKGTWSTRVVIDASGRSHQLARLLGVHYLDRSPRLIARYGYVTGSLPLRDEAPKISGDRDGWTWTAKVRDGLYQWTRVNFSGVASNTWLPQEFTGMTPLSRTKGADVTWRMAKILAGRNWFMTGDAATVLDPTSSRGVQKSIMTGMMAGHLTHATLHGKLSPSQAAQTYHNWLQEWFSNDMRKMTEFYRILGARRQDRSQ